MARIVVPIMATTTILLALSIPDARRKAHCRTGKDAKPPRNNQGFGADGRGTRPGAAHSFIDRSEPRWKEDEPEGRTRAGCGQRRFSCAVRCRTCLDRAIAMMAPDPACRLHGMTTRSARILPDRVAEGHGTSSSGPATAFVPVTMRGQARNLARKFRKAITWIRKVRRDAPRLSGRHDQATERRVGRTAAKLRKWACTDGSLMSAVKASTCRTRSVDSVSPSTRRPAMAHEPNRRSPDVDGRKEHQRVVPPIAHDAIVGGGDVLGRTFQRLEEPLAVIDEQAGDVACGIVPPRRCQDALDLIVGHLLGGSADVGELDH